MAKNKSMTRQESENRMLVAGMLIGGGIGIMVGALIVACIGYGF